MHCTVVMHTIGQLKQLTIFNNEHSVYYHALFLALYYNTQCCSLWAYVREVIFTIKFHQWF